MISRGDGEGDLDYVKDVTFASVRTNFPGSSSTYSRHLGFFNIPDILDFLIFCDARLPVISEQREDVNLHTFFGIQCSYLDYLVKIIF